MYLPFNNIDVVKYVFYLFKDEPHNLLKLTHTSSFFRKEIIENEIYPDMIDIIKNNNIYQVKQFEIDIINIKNKDSLITILENYIINLRKYKNQI